MRAVHRPNADAAETTGRALGRRRCICIRAESDPPRPPEAASSKDVVQVTIAVPPVPPLNQGPPEPNTCPRTLELPNAITPPEIQARGVLWGWVRVGWRSTARRLWVRIARRSSGEASGVGPP